MCKVFPKQEAFPLELIHESGEYVQLTEQTEASWAPLDHPWDT